MHSEEKQGDHMSNCTFYNISAERHVNDTCEGVNIFTDIVASVLPRVK